MKTHPHRSTRRARSGLTLVEMLISVTITLLVVFAIVEVFDLLGDSMANSRATIEMAGNLRTVLNQLQSDLDNATCRMHPPVDPDTGEGYLQYVEGAEKDSAAMVVGSVDTSYGDGDDWIALTIRNDNQPFRGRAPVELISPVTTIESTLAEVVWWTANMPPEPGLPSKRIIFRRVRLVAPWLTPNGGVAMSAADAQQAIGISDISLRYENGFLIANSMSDLSRRIARTHGQVMNGLFAPRQMMNEWNSHDDGPLTDQDLVNQGLSRWLMLSDCLSFDVKVFDPTAVIGVADSQVPLHPSDPGYTNSVGQIGVGAFVDVGGNHVGTFSLANMELRSSVRVPNFIEGLSLATEYDTWSLHYERDGIDTDSLLGADQAVNGIDDDGVNGIDDIGERETMPPYPVPLRGLKVTVRVIEHSTRQVRQASVVADYTER